MRALLSRRFQTSLRRLGLLGVLLALAGQLALGATTQREPSPRTQFAALAATAILCQPGSNPASRGKPHLPVLAGDLALCPADLARAQAASLPVAEPRFPRPLADGRFVATRRSVTREPPSHHVAAAYPRGPPSLTGV